MNAFVRNPKEHAVLSAKHIAIVGVGSLGSSLADMLVRAGVGTITLIDPDTFQGENLARHILDSSHLGRHKVLGVTRQLLAINPELRVTALWQRFADVPQRPDLVIATSDSYRCNSLVNGYALREGVPAVFASVWGPAKVAEVLYVVPGKTPCYECFAAFRAQEPEIPDDPRRYTDPDFDDSRVPGQEGLWASVLLAAGVQFQVILGLFGLRGCIDFEHTLWLMNISDYHSRLQPLAVTFGTVAKGCAVCDESRLRQLERPNLEARRAEPVWGENPPVTTMPGLLMD